MKIAMGGRSQGKSVAPYFMALSKADGATMIKLARLLNMRLKFAPELEYSSTIKKGNTMPRGVERKLINARALIFKQIKNNGRVHL